MCKDVIQLLRLAKNLDYNIKRFKNGHRRIDGNGHTFIISSTPRSTDAIITTKKWISKLGPNKTGNEPCFKWHA